MAVLKVIEILASSEKGWEDAAIQGVKEASKTVKNIRSAYVKEQSCVVEADAVTQFRVTLKVSFEVR